MSKSKAYFGANAARIFAVCVIVLGALGAGTYFGWIKPKLDMLSEAKELTSPSQSVAPADDTSKVVDDPDQQSEPGKIAVVPISPSIDEVRSAADGLTVLAGRGEPGGKITLFVDNSENTTVDVGNDGAFAIVVFLDPAPTAKVLSLVQRVGNIELAAADIILAPQAVAQVTMESTPRVGNNEPAALEAIDSLDTAAATEEPAQSTTIAEAFPKELAIVETQNDVVEVANLNVANAAESVQVDLPETPLAVTDVETVERTDAEEPIVDPSTEGPKIDAAAVPNPESQVAILKSDETGVQIINRSSAPSAMTNVEIDTISYSEQGDVFLSGRAQAQATSVRVYLDNVVIAILDVDKVGRWRGDLPDVDTGVFTLRVDEVNTAGTVISRVETPFKRESPEALVAAGGTDNAPAKAITVQTGATLWAIARDRYGDGTLYVRVFEANADAIKDADLIYPGQVFDLPD